ncbi:hypothetical protein D3C83_208470 [compost metagenome]
MRASRAEGKIALAQRFQQIRHRLQREHDAVAERGGGDAPQHQHREARRDNRLRGVIAGP